MSEEKVYVLNLSMSIGELDKLKDIQNEKAMKNLFVLSRRGSVPDRGEYIDYEALPMVFQIAVNPKSDTELTANEKLGSMIRLYRTAVNELNLLLCAFMANKDDDNEFGQDRFMRDLSRILEDGFLPEDATEEQTEQEQPKKQYIVLKNSDGSFIELDTE